MGRGLKIHISILGAYMLRHLAQMLVTSIMYCLTFGAVAQSPTASPVLAKPALAVKLVTPSMQSMTSLLVANGSIVPWAEASVSVGAGGYRLIQVLGDMGETVKKGQLLASLSTGSARAELEVAKAIVDEAEANSAEAVAVAAKARENEKDSTLSSVQLVQIFSQEKAAMARVRAAKAKQVSAELLLKETDVVSPDDGVISVKTAMLGAVVPQGGELFRLIRQGRLEWRAELTGSELANIQPGMTVMLAGQVRGVVRQVAPTIDPVSRIALAYVDISAEHAARAGLRPGAYVRGEFAIGKAVAQLSVQQSALLLRDGFSYVFVLGSNNKVTQVKVQTGARLQIGGIDWIAVKQGLKMGDLVVASGGAFLADGDTVKVTKP
jgi:RND family efflux transporter MFP subunit